MKKCFIRVDAYPDIGLGHFVRCLALAKTLRLYLECVFLLQDRSSHAFEQLASEGFRFFKLPTTNDFLDEIPLLEKMIDKGDFLIIDGYKFSKGYLSFLNGITPFTLHIDDLNEGVYDSAIVLNQNFHAEDEAYDFDPGKTKILKGPLYSLLREEFYSPRFSPSDSDKACTICMGGADVHNVSEKIYSGLRAVYEGEINLIIGGLNPHIQKFQSLAKVDRKLFIKQNLNAEEMAHIMSVSHLFICTASVISLEAAAVGTRMVTGFTEKNQEKMSRAIGTRKLGIDIGNLYELNEKNFSLIANDLLVHDFEESVSLQKTVMSYQSKIRVMAEMFKLSAINTQIESERFYFRILRPEMVGEKYLSWFDNSDVKKNILSAGSVHSINDLKQYVSTKFEKADSFFWGIFDKANGLHIGNIKYDPLDWASKSAVMGILIGDPKWRGCGVAGEAILSTSDFLKGYGINQIFLGVDNTNSQAVNAYYKIGFKKSDNSYLKIDPSKGFEMKLAL